MKQTVKTSRAAEQLEKMFRVLNQHYFEGKLPEPIISLKKTPSAYGHITCAKVWQAGEESKYEINISSATLNRPIEDTTATLRMRWCTSTAWRTASKTPLIMASTTTAASKRRQRPTAGSFASREVRLDHYEPIGSAAGIYHRARMGGHPDGRTGWLGAI